MLNKFRTGDLVINMTSQQLHVILGNCVREDGSIWCANWETLQTCYPPQDRLNHQEDVSRPKWDDLVRKLEERAASGDAYAMWWCAWAHEGTNHAKSVWYYMAAMRRVPEKHGWAFERVYYDAHSAIMCEGVSKPDLAFLKEISEFQSSEKWGDWKQAIAMAIAAAPVSVEAHILNAN